MTVRYGECWATGMGRERLSVAERSGHSAVILDANQDQGCQRPVADVDRPLTPRAHRWLLSATAVTCRGEPTVAVQSQAVDQHLYAEDAE